MNGQAAVNRREQLIEAAAELFLIHGAEGTSMRHLGEHIGLTGQAVYRYFPSKEELLDAVLDRFFVGVTAALSHRDPVGAAVEFAITSPNLLLVHLGEGDLSRSGSTLSHMVDRLLPSFAALAGPDADLPRYLAVGAMFSWTGMMFRVACRTVPVTSAFSWPSTTIQPKRMAELLRGVYERMVEIPNGTRAVRVLTPTKPDAPPWRPVPHRAEEVVGAAASRFRRDGYHAVGVDEIAADAGMSGSGVYRYFSSKAEILSTLHQLYVAGVENTVNDALEQATDQFDALDRLLSGLTEYLQNEVSLAVVSWRDGRFIAPELRAEFRRAQSWSLRKFAAVINEVHPQYSAEDAEFMAWCAFDSMVTGAVAVGHVEPDEQPLMPSVALTLAGVIVDAPTRSI